MKKILLILAVMMIQTSLTMAQKFENAQTIRQKVADFAKKHGMTTEMPEDNVLTIQKDTLNYVMIFTSDNPTFVELRPFDYSATDANYSCLSKAANVVNQSFGGIKVTINPDRQGIRLSVGMLAYDAATVTRLLEHYLELLDKAWLDMQIRFYEFNDNKDFSEIRLPFEVYCADIANTDIETTVIGETNSEINSAEGQYIHIGLNLIGYEEGEFPISARIIIPDGTYLVNGIGNKYTFTTKINVSQGVKFYDLGGWGSAEEDYWKPGNYRYELYYNDKLFYIKTFNMK